MGVDLVAPLAGPVEIGCRAHRDAGGVDLPLPAFVFGGALVSCPSPGDCGTGRGAPTGGVAAVGWRIAGWSPEGGVATETRVLAGHGLRAACSLGSRAGRACCPLPAGSSGVCHAVNVVRAVPFYLRSIPGAADTGGLPGCSGPRHVAGALSSSSARWTRRQGAARADRQAHDQRLALIVGLPGGLVMPLEPGRSSCSSAARRRGFTEASRCCRPGQIRCCLSVGGVVTNFPPCPERRSFRIRRPARRR